MYSSGNRNVKGLSAKCAALSPFPWYALKVRTGSEVLAAVGLVNRGYDPFVPVYCERRQYSDRIKNVERPAFPGYIFCRFDARKKAPVLSSPAVSYAVSCSGVVIAIADADIEAVRRALHEGARPVPYLRLGQLVRIERGVLAGIEGILTRNNDEDNLIVSIHLLQRSVSVRIPANYVRAIVPIRM
jgi:transcription antitermination factor NusG